MPPVVYATTSFTELERFMASTLCDQERMDVGQVKIRRTVMRQGTTVIGFVVRIEGPRLTRCHAIWAEREYRVLFYNSAGQRFAVVKLAESPHLQGEIEG